ncbi:hypothetical protein RKE38_04770 [Phycicoccus sp. M110.8]|uniref:hypothetical protein n=1 Tax=Phycicoccus sp. M110.8 TaxID=3075433 RepID=UPI0028FD9A97|nr:hypothetical protein [Phycicoccus sp. M110.8]MDU0312991.1 hypothetical protein [Phycicoccus sp. M110.8]
MTTRTRLALTSAVAVVALGTAGCTGGSGSGSGGHGSAAPARSATSSTSGSTPSRATVKDTRADIPRVSPAKLADVSYAKASAGRMQLFSPVAKASGGLATQRSVTTVRVGGKDAGVVAVYTLKPGSSKSTTFQDQYVVQLLNSVSRSTAEPRFVKVGSQVMALSTGQRSVAGWVSSNQLVLVLRQGSQPDLAALAAAVQATPLKG